MTDGRLPGAGYYTDPDNPSVQRWWDGEQWAVPPPPVPVDTLPPAVAPEPPATNVYAVASLVLALAWVAFVGSVLAVIFGHIAVAQIRASDGREGGRGIAMAGLIVGYIGVGILAFLTLALIAA